MTLHNLQPSEGSLHKRNRVGRGPSSGSGKTSGRGHKGQKSRKSGMPPRGFEGGQMPLHRRLPKRGFRNERFATRMAVVQLSNLAGFEAGSVIDEAFLRENGLIAGRGRIDGVKIIGQAELDRSLTLKVTKVSEGAKRIVEAAGGTVEVI